MKKLLILAILILPNVSFAADFNPNRIISDADLTDYSRMSLTAIQSFLNEQGGVLAGFRTADTDGVERSAAEIILNTSYRYRLNPQFLLVTVQKEASLLTTKSYNLFDWAMGFGVCDSCSKDDPSVLQYKGFSKQISAAAERIRSNSYLGGLDGWNSTISGWGVGRSKTTLDGITITPENKATAVLYTYTPWVGYHGGEASVGGNSLFFDLMERYFPNRTSTYFTYPNLTLLRNSEDGKVYKLEHNRLRQITSATALLANYDINRIVNVKSSVIDRYDKGYPITMPRFILVQGPGTPVYLIDSQHKRRAITNTALFRTLGYNPEEVVGISQTELYSIPEGGQLTANNAYPLGAVLRNKKTGSYVFIDSKQVVHPILAKSLLEERYKGYATYEEPAKKIKQYPKGKPAVYADGTLLKIPERNTIYVVDNGKKRPIPSKDILRKLGGKKSVVTTNKVTLKLHPNGEPMTLHKVDSDASSN